MNYAQIRKMDISDGEGIRVSVYVSGCKFHCKNCYNLEVQNFNYGQLFTEDKAKDIIGYIEKPYVSGLSILGGDPLWQDEEGLNQLISLCKEVHKLSKTIWIWSGFVWEDIFSKNVNSNIPNKEKMQELISNTDVFIDGRFIEELKNLTLKWKGSSNQRVINVKESLKQHKIIIYC